MFSNWRFGLRRRRRSVTTTPANVSCEKQRTKKKVQRVRNFFFLFSLFSPSFLLWVVWTDVTSFANKYMSVLPSSESVPLTWADSETSWGCWCTCAGPETFKTNYPTWSEFACPANQHPKSASKKNKSHIPLRTSWISPPKMSAMFDSNLVILTIGWTNLSRVLAAWFAFPGANSIKNLQV